MKFSIMKLIVLGEPTAQKRHRSVRIGGFTRQYDPSASDKGDFLSIVQKNAPKQLFTTPLKVDLEFYFARPKSHYRSGKNSHLLKDNCSEWHTSRPDCDNLQKLVYDALNKVFWKDDSIICHISVIKKYSDTPRTEINIEEI